MNKFARRRLIAAAAILCLLLGGIAGGLIFWVNNQGRSGGENVRVSIDNGSSGSTIAKRLEDKGVIRSSWAFRLFMRLTKSGEALKAGEYQLQVDMPFPELAAELQKGPEVAYVRLPIPEGLNIEQTAAQVEKHTHISAADFIAAATPSTIRPSILPPESNTLEGFLYPTTLFVEDRETANTLVRRLVQHFEDRLADQDTERAAELGRTPYEILIIASMIEEEAKANNERSKMSAVIHNRLRRNMPLGIDATIQYAVHKYEGQPLTQSDLRIDSPFNTRTRAGLPPHPISSPRAGSLHAALHPSRDNFLFYVLGEDCIHHVFTDNNAEFLRAKARQPDNC